MVIWILLGIVFGFGIASAISSFLLMIGLVQKLAERTLTTHALTLYKWVVCLGVITGVFIAVGHPVILVGECAGTVITTFMGMYVGLVAISLTETLRVLPILFKKMNLTIGTRSILYAVVLGKVLGSLLYYTKLK